MDFEWNDDQRAILAAVDALCAQHAGPARAIALDAKADWDEPLDAALARGGLRRDRAGRARDRARSRPRSWSAEVARHAGTLPVGAQVLVAPDAGRAHACPAPSRSSRSRTRARFASAHTRARRWSTAATRRGSSRSLPATARPCARTSCCRSDSSRSTRTAGESLGQRIGRGAAQLVARRARGRAATARCRPRSTSPSRT